jgi:nucleotide-binding universal stress UspA family protein
MEGAMFENVLLAVDGSKSSMQAAQIAAEIARCHKGILRIVVAFDPLPSYLGEPNLQAALSIRMKKAEEILSDALDAVGSVPGEIHSEILEGPPAEAILHVAEIRHNDLIVMGSRGLGRLTGLLLGSQSHKVVTHAPCPVLIVR